MSYCFVFCDSPSRRRDMFEHIHEPLRKLVRKSGWRIDVHAFNDDDMIINLYQDWPNNGRFQFKDKFDNAALLVEAVENKFYEVTAKKPNTISENTLKLIEKGIIKVYTWKQYQQWKQSKI